VIMVAYLRDVRDRKVSLDMRNLNGLLRTYDRAANPEGL